MLTSVLASVPAPPAPFEAPGTEIFIQPAINIAGVDVTRSMIYTILISVAVVLFFMVAARKRQMVPKAAQNIAEMTYDFIRHGVAMETMGKEGLPFVPLLASMFVFLVVNNILGIIPGVNFANTARMAIPILLSVMVWFIFNIVGIIKQGGWTYVKGVLFPPGVPKPIYLLVTPIEFISTFLLRPVTLAVRLFANMVAGHLILTIFAVGTWYLASHLFVDGAQSWVAIWSIPSFFLLLFMMLFEILVAFLQAYIFTLLTAVYIGGAMHAEH